MAVNISVIIVNYRANAQVENLKRSLRGLKDAEVIVVDNSLVTRGYGEGANLGAAQASGDYLVFTNPDIKASPRAIQNLVAVLENQPAVGLVGPQIRRPDGTVEITSCAEPKPFLALVEYSFLRGWPIFRQLARGYRLSGFDHLSSRNVDIVSGSCLAMRTVDFQRLNGFDTNIFLYFEEFDLAKRVREQLHKQVWFCAQASIIHYGQASTKQLATAAEHFRRSRRYWFRKAYGWLGSLVVGWLEITESL